MATRRSERYNLLKLLGFTHFEAVQYSKIPMYGDVIRFMAKERYADYKKEGEPPINSSKWIKQIRQEYEAKDWEWNDEVGAWRQYRYYEMIWQERNPNKKDKWQSPPKKHSNKRYNALNRDAILQQRAKYRATHKEQIRKYAREYRLKKRNVK